MSPLWLRCRKHGSRSWRPHRSPPRCANHCLSLLCFSSLPCPRQLRPFLWPFRSDGGGCCASAPFLVQDNSALSCGPFGQVAAAADGELTCSVCGVHKLRSDGSFSKSQVWIHSTPPPVPSRLAPCRKSCSFICFHHCAARESFRSLLLRPRWPNQLKTGAKAKCKACIDAAAVVSGAPQLCFFLYLSLRFHGADDLFPFPAVSWRTLPTRCVRCQRRPGRRRRWHEVEGSRRWWRHRGCRLLRRNHSWQSSAAAIAAASAAAVAAAAVAAAAAGRRARARKSARRQSVCVRMCLCVRLPIGLYTHVWLRAY